MEWPDKLEECIDEAGTLEDGVADFVRAFISEFPESRELLVEALGEAEGTHDTADKFSNPAYFGIKASE